MLIEHQMPPKVIPCECKCTCGELKLVKLKIDRMVKNVFGVEAERCPKHFHYNGDYDAHKFLCEGHSRRYCTECKCRCDLEYERTVAVRPNQETCDFHYDQNLCSCFFVTKCECICRQTRGYWLDCKCIYEARIGQHQCECRYNKATKAYECICCRKIIYTMCESCAQCYPECVICGRHMVQHRSRHDCSYDDFWRDSKPRDRLGFICCTDHTEAQRCEYIKAELEIRLTKLSV